MKVFVTGATGFTGLHTAIELLNAGHELRLLVRDAEFARRLFVERGYQVDDLVVADMCDRDAIRSGMADCDAVFHAAAMVSLDPLQGDKVYRTNTGSIASVIETAIDLGIKNILWVSSSSVFLRPGVFAVDETSALAEPAGAYARSKADCERRVRELQASGAPIQITYPSGIIGPDDPRLSESNAALGNFLSLLPRTSSGVHHVDVRDLACIHRYLLEHPPESDFDRARYIVAGHYASWIEIYAILSELTGCKIANPRLPGWFLRFVGRLLDLAQRIRPFETQLSAESMRLGTQCPVADSSRIIAHTGLTFRPLAESFRDTIRWLAQAGHVQPEQAGRLAPGQGE